MKSFFYTLAIALFSFTAFSQKITVKNNSFTSDTNNWDMGIWGPEGDKPTAFFNIIDSGQDDNKALKVAVRKNSDKKTGDQAFLKQSGFKIKKGKKYKISFWVKSNAYKDNILFRIYSGEDTGSSKPWGAIVDETFDFDGNGRWQNITHVFEARPLHNLDVDYKNMALLFGFDKRKGSFYIDNISLERL